MQALEPYCGEFLYTHVDKEGLMQGTDMDAIQAVRDATARRVTAAGGITTREEIDALDAVGVDAVVGMAIYTGSLPLERVTVGAHWRLMIDDWVTYPAIDDWSNAPFN